MYEQIEDTTILFFCLGIGISLGGIDRQDRTFQLSFGVCALVLKREEQTDGERKKERIKEKEARSRMIEELEKKATIPGTVNIRREASTRFAQS